MPADTVSIISAAFVTVITAVLTYLKAKDAMEFKRINTELEAAKAARAESLKDREEIRADLIECNNRHDECDRRASALEVKTVRLETEVSYLKQHVQSRPT